jgi:hypothetical protein
VAVEAMRNARRSMRKISSAQGKMSNEIQTQKIQTARWRDELASPRGLDANSQARPSKTTANWDLLVRDLGIGAWAFSL